MFLILTMLFGCPLVDDTKPEEKPAIEAPAEEPKAEEPKAEEPAKGKEKAKEKAKPE
jgi:hypothetical protein